MGRSARPLFRSTVATAAAALALVAGCSAAPPPGTDPPPGTAPAAAAPEGLVGVPVTIPAALAGDAAVPEGTQALVPPGWSMSLWANLDEARKAIWAPDGSLLVSRPDAGEVVRLVRAGDASRTEPLLSGLVQPHGLAFAPDGRLLVAESNAVRAYTYADGRASAPTTVADGLPDGRSPDLQGAYSHALKSVAVGPDGAVYITVGSTGNISVEDRDATPERASVLRVPPGGGPAETFARGVRNGTALAIAPDGALWTANNGRDNLPFPYDRPYGEAGPSAFGQVIPDYVDDHPPEQVAKLTPGRELGWPYCNVEPDEQPGVPGSPMRTANLPMIADAETNPGGRVMDCAALAPVEQSMGSHSAPLGMEFADVEGLGRGALVGVHGSWNRQDPQAPEVSFYPWAGGGLGEQQTLVGGFQDASGQRWGRPVAAVLGPDRALYVTDDEAGAVYRVAPPAAG